jgi:lycopene cyclase domain-containing protein
MSSYLFLLVALVLFVAVLTHGRVSWSFVLSRWFVTRGLALVLVYFLVDQAAVALGLWYFPEGRTFPIRFLELPLEEYLLFFISTGVCALMVRFFLGGERA